MSRLICMVAGCLLLACHGRRVQTIHKDSHEALQKAADVDAKKAFATMLMGSDPSAAWHVGIASHSRKTSAFHLTQPTRGVPKQRQHPLMQEGEGEAVPGLDDEEEVVDWEESEEGGAEGEAAEGEAAEGEAAEGEAAEGSTTAEAEGEVDTGMGPDVSEEEQPMTIYDLSSGMELNGTVSKIESYGAFINCGVGRDGLLHVSQMGKKGEFIDDASKKVSIGQNITVWVRSVDKESQKYGLTLNPQDLVPNDDDEDMTRKKITNPDFSSRLETPLPMMNRERQAAYRAFFNETAAEDRLPAVVEWYRNDTGMVGLQMDTMSRLGVIPVFMGMEDAVMIGYEDFPEDLFKPGRVVSVRPTDVKFQNGYVQVSMKLWVDPEIWEMQQRQGQKDEFDEDATPDATNQLEEINFFDGDTYFTGRKAAKVIIDGNETSVEEVDDTEEEKEEDIDSDFVMALGFDTTNKEAKTSKTRTRYREHGLARTGQVFEPIRSKTDQGATVVQGFKYSGEPTAGKPPRKKRVKEAKR